MAEASGADVVISYKTEHLADQILDATNGQGVDRIVEVEFGANLAISNKVLKTSGVIATYASSIDREPSLPFYQMMFNNVQVQMILVYNMSEAAKQQAIADTQAALTNENLDHRIAKVFALDDIAGSHQAIESESNDGCVVVEID